MWYRRGSQAVQEARAHAASFPGSSPHDQLRRHLRPGLQLHSTTLRTSGVVLRFKAGQSLHTMATAGIPSSVDEILVDESAFELHHYVDALAGLTPPTVVVALPVDVRSSLLELCPVLCKAYFLAIRTFEDLTRPATPFTRPAMSWLDFPGLPPLIEPLKAWAATLDLSVERFRASGSFPRLSSRSPKDSLALRRRADAASASDAEHGGYLCRSGLEVVELLATSERVFADLGRAASAGTPSFVLLRAWADMPPDNEFRAFVLDGKVTAISQYATQATLTALQAPGPRARVVAAIIVQAVLSRLPPEPYRASCVVDLSWSAVGLARAAEAALEEPRADVKALCNVPAGLSLVELNPFCRRTGAGLFSWRDDWAVLSGSRDRRVDCGAFHGGDGLRDPLPKESAMEHATGSGLVFRYRSTVAGEAGESRYL